MRLSLPLSLVLLTTLLACSPTRVSYDYDTQASYGRYHTYAWASAPEPSQDNFTDRRLRSAVDSALALRGFKKVEGDPDLLVTCNPVYADQPVRTGVGVGVGLRILPGVTVGMNSHSARTEHHTTATLFLTFSEPKSGQVVWKAQAENAFDTGLSPEEAEADIRDVVNRILERFPPTKR